MPSKQPGSAFSALPETALTGLLNHLLSQHSWASARLRPHAGKTLQLRLPLVSAVLSILEDGSFAPALPGVRTDATLIPNPLAWLASSDPAARFMAGGEDAALAKELAEILGNMRWDAEEDLSRVLGDIAAHRLVSTATGVLEWNRRAAETIARSWAEHWQEENPMLAQPGQVHAFFKEVGEVHDRVEQLEKKIRQLGQ
jgi:ubiquinone biosynthesis protein UbiJ